MFRTEGADAYNDIAKASLAEVQVIWAAVLKLREARETYKLAEKRRYHYIRLRDVKKCHDPDPGLPKQRPICDPYQYSPFVRFASPRRPRYEHYHLYIDVKYGKQSGE